LERHEGEDPRAFPNGYD